MMKPFAIFFYIFMLFLIAPLAIADDDSDPLLAQLLGQVASPERSAVEWEAAYEQAVSALIPGMGAAVLVERADPQRTFEALCIQAGQPDQEIQCAALCRVIGRHLGSDVPQPARVWMLRELTWLGGAEVVEPAARLLNDQDALVAEEARRVLVHNPTPAATDALRAALAATSNHAEKIAYIDALAARRDTNPEFRRLLAPCAVDQDEQLSLAAVDALGALGTLQALSLLREFWNDHLEPPMFQPTTQPVEMTAFRRRVANAMLRCAESLSQSDDAASADDVYRTLFFDETDEGLRAAGLHGMCITRQGRVMPVVLGVMTSENESDAFRAYAAELLTEYFHAPMTAQIVVRLVTKDDTPASTCVLGLRVLQGVGDAQVEPGVVQVLARAEPEVRVAAIETLAAIGSPRMLSVLADMAALGKTPAEQAAARRALRTMGDPSYDGEMMALLLDMPEAQVVELLAALGDRHRRETLPVFFDFASHGRPATAIAALHGLGKLASGIEGARVVDVLLAAESPEVRAAAADAIGDICARDPEPQKCMAPLLDAWPQASGVQRLAMMPVLTRIGGERAFRLLRAARTGDDAEVADAAVRALASWQGAEALDELRDIAEHAEKPSQRVLALQGYVRLLQKSDRDAAALLTGYTEAWELARRPEEKRLVLGAVGELASADALAFAQQWTADAEVGAEATMAALAIAQRRAALDRAVAREVIQQLRAATDTDAVRTRADEALAAIDKLDGYLTQWEWCGPYHGEGDDWHYVFDHAFAPEEAAAAADVQWQPVESQNTREPWVYNVQRFIQGENCCIYVRTAVWTEQPRDLTLRVGSDDGVRAFVNGKVVHEYREARGHEPLQDAAPITLHAGWNTIMLKVVQIGGGWEYSAALKTPDGGQPEGLRYGLPQ